MFTVCEEEVTLEVCWLQLSVFTVCEEEVTLEVCWLQLSMFMCLKFYL